MATEQYLIGYEEGFQNGWNAAVDAKPEQPAQQEPVAQWQKRHPHHWEGKWENTNEHDAKWWRDNSQGWEIRPLYTSPPAQHKPLTDEQIWKFWWSRPEVPEGKDDSMEAEFVAAVRAVLAAHGIKENTQPSKPLLEPDYYVYNIDGQYRLADPQPTIKWGNKC